MQVEETLIASQTPVAIRLEPGFGLSAVELQRRYIDDVTRYVLSMVGCREDAEDVVAEVFAAAFRSLSNLRKSQDERIWLIGIARRKCADQARRRSRRRESTLDKHHELVAPESSYADAEAVRQVLQQMPSDQAEALVLKYVSGLTTEEVAIALKRSNQAANSLLQRARERFSRDAAYLLATNDEVGK